MRRDLLLFCTVFLCAISGSAQKSSMVYDELKKEYGHFAENDPHALPYIAKSIASAKQSHDFVHLLNAYEDAAFVSSDRLDKLNYADSCIQAAKKTENPSLISMAYLGKGIVYYFNFRKYDKALDLYLLAAKNAEHSDDAYLKFKIKYQIGVVKSYLGYSNEALGYFKECLLFFEANLKKNLHPHLRYNNMRGYLNTLHQMSICERNLKHDDKAQNDILRMKPHFAEASFAQEKGYFLKETGILEYQSGQFPEAITALEQAEKLLQQRKEEGHLSVTYFYLGKAYLKMNEHARAYVDLKKVDSLFTKNQTVSPEVLMTYELLLKNKNFPVTAEERNGYIDQLLRADRILQSDMPHLASKIHFEYDVQNLRAEKDRLQKGNEKLTSIQTLLIGVGGGGLIFLVSLLIRHYRIRTNYRHLQKKLAEGIPSPSIALDDDWGRKVNFSDEIVEDLVKKLQKFEKGTSFTKVDFNQDKMTKILGTNKNHLSYVLNEHLKTNYNTYIASLRIRYITNLMNTDRQYLKYKSEELAKMCGLKNRQHFSDLFYKYNKIRPSHFIQQKKKELNML